MEHLYSPWRYDYVTEEKIKGCVFCHISENINDEKLQVLFSNESCYVVMNKFPYSPGHMMVVPHLHTDKIEDLPEEVWLEISKRVRQGVLMLKEIMPCDAVNIGMNLGEMAGAGIAQHVHYHMLPRWKGDTNFITAIGGTRVYPANFDQIFCKLKEASKNYFI